VKSSLYDLSDICANAFRTVEELQRRHGPPGARDDRRILRRPDIPFVANFRCELFGIKTDGVVVLDRRDLRKRTIVAQLILGSR
jgi:hypothetical protein